jgi:hypothetical protein
MTPRRIRRNELSRTAGKLPRAPFILLIDNPIAPAADQHLAIDHSCQGDIAPLPFKAYDIASLSPWHGNHGLTSKDRSPF